MLGHDVAPWALKAEKLHKDYPGVTAVQQLDFTIDSGVVHGFLGPNGAGKSTSLRMMCGLLRPTSGRVLVEGFDPVEQPFEVKSRVGLLPENPPLYRDMTVNEYLTFTARLHQVKAIQDAVDRVLTLTNTTHVANRLIGNLSKGYRQRVGIAQALVHDPRLVVLDEPTAGLDPESVVEVRALIKSLKKDKTVIFSSHLLHEVEEVCDTISIIAHGQLMAHGPLSEVRQEFAGQALVQVEVAGCSDEQAAKLRKLPYVASLEVKKTQLSLLLNTKDDVRAELVRAMVAGELDILGLEQKGPELEKIFLQVTRNRGEA
jgi:ABC-2 type transport system ATP-binding protein